VSVDEIIIFLLFLFETMAFLLFVSKQVVHRANFGGPQPSTYSLGGPSKEIAAGTGVGSHVCDSLRKSRLFPDIAGVDAACILHSSGHVPHPLADTGC